MYISPAAPSTPSAPSALPSQPAPFQATTGSTGLVQPWEASLLPPTTSSSNISTTKKQIQARMLRTPRINESKRCNATVTSIYSPWVTPPHQHQFEKERSVLVHLFTCLSYIALQSQLTYFISRSSNGVCLFPKSFSEAVSALRDYVLSFITTCQDIQLHKCLCIYVWSSLHLCISLITASTVLLFILLLFYCFFCLVRMQWQKYPILTGFLVSEYLGSSWSWSLAPCKVAFSTLVVEERHVGITGAIALRSSSSYCFKFGCE